jgi:hypothetical protein
VDDSLRVNKPQSQGDSADQNCLSSRIPERKGGSISDFLQDLLEGAARGKGGADFGRILPNWRSLSANLQNAGMVQFRQGLNLAKEVGLIELLRMKPFHGDRFARFRILFRSDSRRTTTSHKSAASSGAKPCEIV